MSTTLYWSQFCQFSDFDSLGSIHFRIVEINKRWVSLSFSFLLNLNMRQAATRGLQNCQCPCQLLIIIIIIASLYCDIKYPNGIALSSGVKWSIITVIASHCCKIITSPLCLSLDTQFQIVVLFSQKIQHSGESVWDDLCNYSPSSVGPI